MGRLEGLLRELDKEMPASKEHRERQLSLGFPRVRDYRRAALRVLDSIEPAAEPEVKISVEPEKEAKVHPDLERFYMDYEKWTPEHQARLSWEDLQKILLGKRGALLRQAEGLNDGGVLFGADNAGVGLVADKGVEPVLTGLDYRNTRWAVYGNRSKPTGYEMFSADSYGLGQEMKIFEEFTGGPFVGSADDGQIRSAWLDEGQNPETVRIARFRPGQGVHVDVSSPNTKGEGRGTRRLLRLRDPRRA